MSDNWKNTSLFHTLQQNIQSIKIIRERRNIIRVILTIPKSSQWVTLIDIAHKFQVYGIDEVTTNIVECVFQHLLNRQAANIHQLARNIKTRQEVRVGVSLASFVLFQEEIITYMWHLSSCVCQKKSKNKITYKQQKRIQCMLSNWNHHLS